MRTPRTPRGERVGPCGPHFGVTWDLGNIYDRRLEEEYISAPLQLTAGKRPGRLSWKATTPHGTGVRFQIRSASRRDRLGAAAWRGPSSGVSYFEKPGLEIDSPDDHLWLQYRAVMTTPDGGSTPVLEEVRITVRD